MAFSARLFPVEMKVLVWILLSFQGVFATEVIYRNHTCNPSSYSKLCILNHLHYKPHNQRVIHVFPGNLTHVRFGSELKIYRDFTIRHFDSKLYGMMGQPRILEMADLWLSTVELSRVLLYGNFQQNAIHVVSVETGDGDPLIKHLDLSSNLLRNLANLSSLVNLEVLLLGYNFIESIDTTMRNLTKLKHLDLARNTIKQLSSNIFPKSLTHLNLRSNNLVTLNYADLYFPSLEILNIERNELNSIEASALILAMPKLKLARIGRNQIDLDDLQEIVQQFRKHNVSILGEADEVACGFDEGTVEGVCLKDLVTEQRTVFRDVVMSLAVVLVAVVLVLILLFVFRAMNK